MESVNTVPFNSSVQDAESSGYLYTKSRGKEYT